MKIVLFSPNKYSDYSLAVYELLLKNNIKIDYVFCLDYSFKRIFKDIIKHPFELLKKIIKKLLFKKYFYKTHENVNGLLDLRKTININFKHLNSLNSQNTKTFFYNNFNHSSCIDHVRQINPDLIIFTGGGIIRKEMLKLPKIGILNSHMGILPKYRGMHVAEWAILNDDYDNIGCSSHLMELKVDIGRVIDIRKIKLDNIFSINQLYSVFERNMAESVLNSTIKLKSNNNYYMFIADETPLYYRMNNSSIKLVQNKLKTLKK